MSYYYLESHDDDNRPLLDPPDHVSWRTAMKLAVTPWAGGEFFSRNDAVFDYEYTWSLQIFSSKAVDLISLLGPQDFLEWIPVPVKHLNGIETHHFLMRFLRPLDILDEAKTLRDPSGGVVRPVLDEGKCEGLHLFSWNPDSTRTFVSEDLRRLVKENKLTGFNFSKVASTLS